SSPIYAFFQPMPTIEYHDQRCCHVFKCAAHGCNHRVRCYLDKKDVKSTGNMHKHIKSCWGQPALQAAMDCGNPTAARDGPIKSLLETGSIKTSFDHKGKGKVTYSHCQHTHTETRAEIVRWVSEGLHSFETAKDRGFSALMKTGRPEYYIPSPKTTYYSDLSPYNMREWTCIISCMIRASGPWTHGRNILNYDGWAGSQIIPDGGGWAHAGNM
ncbi:hypothetical protein BDR05DRAFT_894513, partial [Suillus weaverae]